MKRKMNAKTWALETPLPPTTLNRHWGILNKMKVLQSMYHL